MFGDPVLVVLLCDNMGDAGKNRAGGDPAVKLDGTDGAEDVFWVDVELLVDTDASDGRE